MARKKYGKHSKTPAATSATARRSHVALGAATAVVGASLALGVTPAFAQTGAAAQPGNAAAQPGNAAAQPAAPANNKPANPQTPVAKQGDKKQVETNKKQADTAEKTERGGVSSTKPAAGNKAASNGSVAPQSTKAVQGKDRGATDPTPDKGPQANSTVELSKEKKDTLPNMYAWGSSNNVYIENGQNQEVKFILKSVDGVAVTKVAIFPNDNIDINGRNAKQFVEYRTDDADGTWHQAYSGKYSFVTNNADGSATLTMSPMYRDNKMPAAGYTANRCIYVYGMKDGQEVLLYKTNIARTATLIPPKKTGSVVLKYNEELTDEQIRAKLKAALDAPTEGKDGKSLREQIKDASTAKGVGVRDKNDNRKLDTTPDDPEKKVVVTDKQAYLPAELAKINTVTSAADAKEKTYKTGVTNLKTYLVSDLGYKSEALALTVARYDTRIDKPVVTDPNNISDDVKKEIAKKLANLNHIPQDKVTVNADGTVTINFEGVDPSLAPNLKLSDLVLKQLAEADVNVPTGDKATFVANPLGYSKAELDRIKQSILDANKDNEKLGLTSKDQITLSYIEGDTVTAGHKNQGISNGQAENTITVKIKTDKAVAEFTSNVKESKLTKLPNIRTDYNVSWDKTKIDGRDTDEGISWSNDSKTTIIYRYDPTKAEEFDTTKILGLLKAAPKDKQAGLRDLTGGEKLDHEDSNGKPRKSHMHYALKDDEPTGELSLGNMSGAYWKGDQKVSHSDEKLGDNLSEAGSYSWDTEAGSVKVAGKKGKIYKARLFVQPYAMSYYKDVYLEQGRNPGNTAKAINIIFVPQTNHKTGDLKKSVDEHKLAADKTTPTDSAYYNASDKVKKDYEDALSNAKTLYESVKDTDESKLTEEQKAQIDNATITLNKARAALDGAKTDKNGLTQSIEANGKAKEGQAAEVAGTVTTDKYKNVTEPDFKKADGSADTERNEAAKKAKEAYDKALQDAEAVKDDANATQKAVDAAKAKLDAARKELDKYTTNKDELNAAIAAEGKVNTGDADKTGEEKLKTADPTYQNSTKEERDAYDKAVAEAQKVVGDPNASQKEVNEAIKKLKDAKAALDKNATDKAPLDAAVQKTLDNDSNKHSVFYTNAKNKTGDQAAQKAVDDYDKALAEAKRVLGDKNATKADVEKAKKDLEDAEKVLYAETYQTKTTDLAEAIADNFSGYLMPAYFNAFDKAQAEGKDSQAAKDFKAYNDAYHAAKDLLAEIKKPNSTVTQDQANKVKDKLIEARKAIDKYATDTSKISAALLQSLAITNSPAYKNAAANTDPNSAEAQAKKAYDDALEALQKAFNDEMPQDTVDGKPGSAPISTNNIPVKDGDTSSPDYLKNIQSHAKGQPLNRDVTKLLAKLNDAVKGLDKFKTKTDDLIKSINEDDNTKQTPAYKNASLPVFQKADSADADADKNAKAKQAVDKYGEMLNKAKDLLKNPAATQAQIDEAKKNLDDARKALLGDPKDQANTPGFNTDITKLQKSVDKHGKEKQGDTAATEGTVTSDAYRNASDPHFMKEEGGKLVPDDDKNKKAAEDKKAYDEALTKAQELLKKHDDKDTPQDAKPTQKDINDALDALDKARTKLDTYKTDTTKLDAEAKKSTAEGATAAGTDFENSPEFKNADDQKGEGNKDNDDVKAYKDALKKARELVKAATSTDPNTKNSDRPTQQQVDEALAALTAAKKQITDNYKTNLDALTAAKDLAIGDFKKTPEYKNAVALKDDNSATADQQKKTAAQNAVNALDDTVADSALKKAKDIIDNPAGKTQKEVDEALKTLQDAMNKVTDNYKTNADKLKNEVGDKDDQGKDVTPPFEATVEYKNALTKKDAESEEDAKKDDSATKKLKDYADKLKAAQDLIAQVNSTDPNADPDKKPTQAQVDQALTDLKAAKDAITNGFKTNAKDLKKETKELKDDGQPKEEKDKFEKSTEYQNALAKTDADSKKDVQTYKDALNKANELLQLFNDDGTPKADIPAGKQIPTQQEVDDAQKALKEIKDKILANYKTNPHDLYEEFDKSRVDKDDTRDGLFEDTPEFKNATAKGDDAAKQALKDYTDKLKAAKEMLDKFDRTTGKPKADLPAGTKVPTQKEMDDALKALQDAKKKITDGYKTNTDGLKEDYDNRNKENSSDYTMASKDKQEEYSKKLDEANKVLKDPNATQADVDAAQKALKDALEALVKSANANRRALYEDMVIDARNALQKLVDANEATHLKDLYTHAEPAAQHEFMAAMDNAKKVLADKEALASELDAARVRLLRALDGLAKHQLPGMTNAGAGAGANGNAGANGAGANGAAGYGTHAAGAYGRGAHAAGRVRAHAGKHLAQTSDPTNALAAAGMLASALGFIAMGFKTKKRRAK